jgi:TPR repeat protein
VRAYSIWSELAKGGDTRANYHMGMMNMFGLGGAKFEQHTGIDNIRIAAKGGYPIAQSFMGFLVESSDGSLVRTGDELALAWWRKGAAGNHCAGVRRLAKAYSKGELGLSADDSKAAEWETRRASCNKR